MEVDYSPYLHVLPDGSIWWPLTDAVKLGAGYLPVRDDHQNPNPVLRPKSNRVAAGARTLLGEFAEGHCTPMHPKLIERDGIRHVEAHEFLDWLSQYVATRTPSTIEFPDQLARAVRDAIGSTRPHTARSADFESLTLALEGWFDKRLADLPEVLSRRVKEDFFPIPWDNLSPDQRRSGALQWDYQNDPATEGEREYWSKFWARRRAVRKQIEHWEQVATPTASDLKLQESRLADLNDQLARMDQEVRQARGDYHLPGAPPVGAKPCAPSEDVEFAYMAYPKAMSQLRQRLSATPEELAAWIVCGPDQGGIAAYRNANELAPPPRFHFPVGTEDFEFVPYLMACWFRADEINQFAPKERYITGTALLERWGKVPGLDPGPYIRAKIAESRLIDMHPIYGQTKGTFSDKPNFPPLTSGLFSLAQIEQIEAKDFDSMTMPAGPEVGSAEWRVKNAKAAADALHDQPGGSREKQARIREIWATGKYSSRNICAEEECAALGMSFDAARRALRNTPKPGRC